MALAFRLSENSLLHEKAIPSDRLFQAIGLRLVPFDPGAMSLATRARAALLALLRRPVAYDRLSARFDESLKSDECLVGLYGRFGRGLETFGLARDLEFLIEQRRLHPSRPSMALAAVFEESPSSATTDDRAEVEARENARTELLRIMAIGASAREWQLVEREFERSFQFEYGGVVVETAAFHPASSRVSRQLEWPTLVFSVL